MYIKKRGGGLNCVHDNAIIARGLTLESDCPVRCC